MLTYRVYSVGQRTVSQIVGDIDFCSCLDGPTALQILKRKETSVSLTNEPQEPSLQNIPTGFSFRKSFFVIPNKVYTS